jgi:sec-independent protein translocase protein TatA
MIGQLIAQIVAMWMPGPFELVVIAVVAILVFGKRLPEIARGMGRSLFEFKRGIQEVNDVKQDITKEIKDVKQDITKEIKKITGFQKPDSEKR